MTGQDDARAQVVTEYEIKSLKERVFTLEAEIRELRKADAEHDRDIGRWRTGIIVLAALGGIATWVINTLSSLKGFVK